MTTEHHVHPGQICEDADKRNTADAAMDLMLASMRPEDVVLRGLAFQLGHDPTHDAVFGDPELRLREEAAALSVRRLGSATDVPLGTGVVERDEDGTLWATALVFGQRAHLLAGLPYLSVAVALTRTDGKPGSALAWLSIADRPSHPGQPPYRLIRVDEPNERQTLLRGHYQAVHVPNVDDDGYHAEWWHLDDPGLAIGADQG